MARSSNTTDRLRSLVAAFDAFHQSLEGETDPRAQMLRENWATVRHRYEGDTLAAAPSQLVVGLEQGLRELPGLFASMTPDCRLTASQAFASALRDHSPAFLAEQDERLAKVLARGSIRGEREFYLVRCAIDIAEGEVERPSELSALYALVERFESRARRGA